MSARGMITTDEGAKRQKSFYLSKTIYTKFISRCHCNLTRF